MYCARVLQFCTQKQPLRIMYAQYRNRKMERENTATTMSTPEVSEASPPQEHGPKLPRKTPKSSVVIIPPEHLCSQIQEIREKHDKGFIRWMPHINMLWPFYEDINDGTVFLDAKQKLSTGLTHVQPFTVTFGKDSFGYFKHKKFCTLWLKPLNMEEVRLALAKLAENEMKDNGEEGACGGNISDATNETIDGNVDQSSTIAESASLLLAENDTKQELNSDSNTPLVSNDHPNEDGGQSKKSKKKRQKKKQQQAQQQELERLAYRPHIPFQSDVIALQRHLEDIYPECNDVGARGEGFKPHLSLGQFPANTVETLLTQFQEEWNEFSFEVKEVYLISREDFHDPFHVRHAVPLAGQGS